MSRVVGVLTIGAAVWSSPALAEGPKQLLPISFLGDVAAVALAFCLPALLAGLWIGARELWQRIGWRTVAIASVAAIVGLAAAFGWSGGEGTGLDMARLITQSGGAR